MSALVLGMLVSSAKSSYDASKNEVAEMSSEIVTIDRLLAKYGPETGEIRAEFRQLASGGQPTTTMVENCESRASSRRGLSVLPPNRWIARSSKLSVNLVRP
jgi:hypothetical protein